MNIVALGAPSDAVDPAEAEETELEDDARLLELIDDATELRETWDREDEDTRLLKLLEEELMEELKDDREDDKLEDTIDAIELDDRAMEELLLEETTELASELAVDDVLVAFDPPDPPQADSIKVTENILMRQAS